MLCCIKMLGTLWLWTCSYFRLLVKWFLRKTTGLCELQRCCYGQIFGAPRTSAVERSLYQSRNPDIKSLIIYLDNKINEEGFRAQNERDILRNSIFTVLRAKKIDGRIHDRFPTSFGKCIEQIWGYKQLFLDVEELRTTQYDCDNPDHEERLLLLWSLLMSEQPLEGRISKQWQDIGFQGDDPKTDFRGMGILGLENLIFFAKNYPVAAKHVLSHSHHPAYGYAFAIVGINLTSMAYRLLKDGALKTHIYNGCKSLASLRAFHQVYCYLFYEFDKYWIESKPLNMMDFSRIHEEFEKHVRAELMISSTVFRLNITVDHV